MQHNTGYGYGYSYICAYEFMKHTHMEIYISQVNIYIFKHFLHGEKKRKMIL